MYVEGPAACIIPLILFGMIFLIYKLASPAEQSKPVVKSDIQEITYRTCLKCHESTPANSPTCEQCGTTLPAISVTAPTPSRRKTGLISKRISECTKHLENIINERERLFVLPSERGIKNTFLDGTTLSHEIIRQDLSKFLTGLREQSEAWRTGKFQGQAVRKEQLLSGFTPLLRDWDKLLSAWRMYGIGGAGIDSLKNLYDDVKAISVDAQQAPFPD